MNNFAQTDTKWSSNLMGDSKSDTIGRVGCALTCYAMFAGITPDIANHKIRDNHGFASLDLIEWAVDAKILGLNYNGQNKNPVYPCIAWTDYYKSHGYPTHYFVVLNAQTIIDPLDGLTKKNPYNILGYQLISSNQPIMDTSEQLLTDLKAGRINEFKMPDGTILQLISYSKIEDYTAMGNDPANLIEVSQDFITQVRQLRTGGFQP